MFDSEGPNKLTLVDALRDFLPIAIKNLKLDHIPKIKLVKSIPDANVPTFGRFVNEEKIIMREFDKQFPEYLSADPVILPENFADGKKPGRKW